MSPLAPPHRTLVKICGLRRPEDLEAARAADADLIGLVFAPSRRRLTPDEAAALLRTAPGHPPAVGVFVDTAAAEIDRLVETVGLAYVQLGGATTAAEAGALRVPYLKVIHVHIERRIDDFVHMLHEYREAAAFVLDSPSPLGGGSGVVADWSLAAAIVAASDRPVLLAGGLRPDNVAAGLAATGAAGVDVSSGVERDGWKDARLIRDFVRAARGSPAPAAQ